nr:PREDICTED: esterase OVCA2-like [Daucus carota subsp. sativus]
MKLTSEMRKSKILCLHGGRSSGVLLKEELEIWPSSVLERMDLVCIDAPFAAYDVDFRAFTWYDDQDVTKMNIMFNESVAYIEETMVKLGPFDGVLGMSMGVALTKVQDLKCVVVISGGKFASVEIATPKLAENAFSSLIQIPSLHIFGENDFAKLGAIELLESFVDPFVILHPGGHEVPELDEKGVKVMNSFLDKVQASFAAPKVIRSLM